jgi:hypothetical protein
MKTAKLPAPKLLPPLSEEEDYETRFPCRTPLKAYFCGCALSGSIASQEEACPTHSDEDLVARAYRLGELMFEKYVEENLSAGRKFNKKVEL